MDKLLQKIQFLDDQNQKEYVYMNIDYEKHPSLPGRDKLDDQVYMKYVQITMYNVHEY